MATRLELQSKLCEILGSDSVYYQPPETIKMEYPAIVYTKESVRKWSADDRPYVKRNRYTVTVIDRRPDNAAIDKLLELPYCSYDRHYAADNLNHDVLTLYF